MRLFISYARVDKHYCQQIVDTLDVHDVWYDRRLHAGQKWWDEILRRLAWCDGFIYLLSRESIASQYCQKEFAIAKQLGKHIFPVMIHQNAPLPESLHDIQYADLSNGLDARAVKQLLSAIYVAERDSGPDRQKVEVPVVEAEVTQPPDIDPNTVIDEAATALDNGDFDRAVFLLKRAREIGYESRFVDLDVILHEAEEALEHQAYLREAEREYRSILALVKRQRTYKIGCEAFQSFRNSFPDYDPDNLTDLCFPPTAPFLEWCNIPVGTVTIERGKRSVVYHLESYRISKYPVTMAEFQVFVDASDGYQDERNWTFSEVALQWHKDHAEILEVKGSDARFPRTNICWYEAMAFCVWISQKTGQKITLPTEHQWQRAACGDQNVGYPWGEAFSPEYANTKEFGPKQLSPVDCYPKGASPFGVLDMAGNAWEWTSTNEALKNDQNLDATHKVGFVVRGGSFLSSADRARNNFHFVLDPIYRYVNIGFRVVSTS